MGVSDKIQIFQEWHSKYQPDYLNYPKELIKKEENIVDIFQQFF